MKVNKTATAALVVLGAFVIWGTLRVTHFKKGSGTSSSTTVSESKTGSAPSATTANQGAQNATVATGTAGETASLSHAGSTSGTVVSMNAKGTGTAGTPSAILPGKSGSTPSEVAKAELQKAEPSGSCAMITFHHKKLSTHASDDECSHHRNLIKLSRTDVNPETVCIRVNNVAVRYERVPNTTDEFIIGPVAGPHDTVTARFCTGKIKCAEACVYPAHDPVKHDEFLEAIGGNDSGEDTKLAHWEAGDAEKTAEVNQAVDGEIKKELENQDEAAKKVAQSKMEIFKEWITDSEKAACGSTARLPASVSASR